MQLSPAVENALAAGKPVVALESTIICHGIPRPRNLQLARDLEAQVTNNGAVPATIALVDGVVRIGLDDPTLVRLAESTDVEKCSINAMAAVLTKGGLGATTVASTIYLAAKSGIRFMATGGIGGVHRGGEDSLDISADLYELRRSPMAVVAAGAKIILDLPRTVEVLETLGISLAGYRTDRLPGFYVRETVHPIPSFDQTKELADLVRHQSALGWPGSILICNPPPRDLSFSNEQIDTWLRDAQNSLEDAQISGKLQTPYLLKKIAEMSDARSVTLNEALVLANAALAAQVASEATQSS